MTKKIAYVYKESGKLSLAAKEYERIETESSDDAIRRDALQVAADLYTQADKPLDALEVYRRYVGYFPQPMELNVETRNKIADILKAQNDRSAYLLELRNIVAVDASAGDARTPRTRFLAGNAALVLAQTSYEEFAGIKLVRPLKASLRKKQELMKKAIKEFNHLVDYELGEITAAATYYLAEIYANFSKSLMTSERPVLTFDYHTVKPGETLSTIAKRYESDVSRIARENNLNKSNIIVAGKKLKIPRGLNSLELEQYELALEDQAYPFEEKAIAVHESNLALISKGVYNEWIDKSLQKLAKFVPARYDKPEEPSEVVASLESYEFALAKPATPTPPGSQADAAGTAPAAAAKAEDSGQAGGTAQSAHTAATGPSGQNQTSASAPAEEPKAAAGAQPVNSPQAAPAKPAAKEQVEASAPADEPEASAGVPSTPPAQAATAKPAGQTESAAHTAAVASDTGADQRVAGSDNARVAAEKALAP